MRVFDRFSVEDDPWVGTIKWKGIYSFCRDEEGAPEPHATGFILEVYSDADGVPAPGKPLWSNAFDMADVNETFTSTRVQTCANDQPENTWAFYDYEATLQTPLGLSADSTYWLMIQAVTPNFRTYWGWSSSVEGEAPSHQEFNDNIQPVTSGPRAYALVKD